jgi:pre-mRNA-splicing helicase BRR2
MDVSYELQKPETEYSAGVPLTLSITLTRDADEDDDDGQVVIAPLYPAKKMANWWLVVGNSVARQLLAIRKVTVRRNLTTKLTFTLPHGEHHLKLYVICDSYSGADHDINLEPIIVAEGDASDSDESVSEEDMDE